MKQRRIFEIKKTLTERKRKHNARRDEKEGKMDEKPEGEYVKQVSDRKRNSTVNDYNDIKNIQK